MRAIRERTDLEAGSADVLATKVSWSYDGEIVAESSRGVAVYFVEACSI